MLWENSQLAEYLNLSYNELNLPSIVINSMELPTSIMQEVML